MARVDCGRLRRLVDERYLTVREHPNGGLLIWDYAPQTVFARYWTPETLMCRGLITTPDGEVVARPFPKFFNLEELDAPLPDEPSDVFEKLDGSLGILYRHPAAPDRPAIATRGSFASGQALRATELLRRRYGEVPWQARVTYLFEVIYPENRVVVDYGQMDDLVLLAAIDTETGAELPLPDVSAWGMPVVRRYEGLVGLSAIASLREVAEANREGYVVRFRSGLRVKVKLGEYVRIHRLLTGVTPRRVWELLASGGSADELVRGAPEEFADWIQAVADELTQAYEAIEATCRTEFRPSGDRRETAAYFQTCSYPPVLFRMLDGKSYAPLIWRALYPDAAQPYTRAEV